MTSVFGNSSFITGQWSRGILRTCESHNYTVIYDFYIQTFSNTQTLYSFSI